MGASVHHLSAEGAEPAERPVWRLVRSGRCSPAENMAIDEAILIGVGGGHSPPTLRFYGWKPAALSIGYFQKAEDEVDLHELRRRGLGFVRRPTGGRAVLHDNELTYSVILPESHPGMPASVGDACRLLNRGLACGLRRLGIDARPAGLPDGGKRPVSPAASAACFDSPSSYELVAGGRKIAGSAQMRQRGAILQHGSVPFELDADLLYAVLRFSSERIRDRMKAAFADRAAAVNDLLRRAGAPPVTPEAAEDAFTAGFEEGLGIRLVPGGLTDEERETAGRLAREKYGSDGWNLRR